jgi:hypothetical protein
MSGRRRQVALVRSPPNRLAPPPDGTLDTPPLHAAVGGPVYGLGGRPVSTAEAPPRHALAQPQAGVGAGGYGAEGGGRVSPQPGYSEYPPDAAPPQARAAPPHQQVRVGQASLPGRAGWDGRCAVVAGR